MIFVINMNNYDFRRIQTFTTNIQNNWLCYNSA